jgi:hypothetical protein
VLIPRLLLKFDHANARGYRCGRYALREAVKETLLSTVIRIPVVTNKCVYLKFTESAVRFLLSISFRAIRTHSISQLDKSSVVSILSINYAILFKVSPFSKRVIS